ncbi:MAG: lantibiotic immunity ABC transporter MutG family permease subunit [Clostridiaceae bacterium]|nr:lantibiotic immunity ABC transporter MutG family permease subunit [Clostridiaceae bacterium]
MPTLIRCIRSDFHKFRHTSMMWIHVLLSLAAAVLFISYYSVSPWNAETKISGYFEVIGVVFPLMIGLVSGKSAEQERQSGNFQTMLCGAKSRTAAYASKLIVLLSLGMIAIAIATGVFAAGFQTAPEIFYFRAAGLLITGSVFSYIVHLFVSFEFGCGASIGLGIVESLISALALTGLGDERWYYIPCTWSARLCDCLVFIWSNPSSAAGYTELGKCRIVAIPATIAAFVLSFFWFQHWEGSRSNE